jgi:uncharacterized protein YcnI
MLSILRMSSCRKSVAFALVLTIFGAAGVSAHAVVFPAEAPTGAYQKYSLRVPNERDFPTTRVVITFPRVLRVISFDEVPGWTLETTGGGESGFTTATWTGTIPVGRFVELSFIGVNPAEPTTLKWDVVQTYGDGTEVAWTGAEGSSTPASLTRVLAPEAAPSVPSSPPPGSGLGTILGGAALVVALISLGLSLRPKAA